MARAQTDAFDCAPPTAGPSSRLPGFYRLSPTARLQALVEAGFLRADEVAAWQDPDAGLSDATADQMIENVIGRFALPIGLGVNFRVNGRDLVVPMVVEEPSIVAAVSHAAGLVRDAGGFVADADRSVMTGQIQIVGLDNVHEAAAALQNARETLLARANALEPNMLRRGGGAVDLEARIVEPDGGRWRAMVVLHVYIDACDAMGANLVNTVCEGLAPLVEELTGGTVVLRILSNRTDRRRVRAACRIPVSRLAWQGFAGVDVASGIVQASEFAQADPWRAATHNKGIMNGIDAAALAVGQDWRAIEAGAHSWAARDAQYAPLAWWNLEDDVLVGRLEMPMAVGIVGGPIRLHPGVRRNLKLLGVQSAAELACVLGAVGLAQNLAAIKALGSTGIQKGHMALHARSVAATAGALPDEVEAIARTIITRGVVKVEEAARALAELRGEVV